MYKSNENPPPGYIVSYFEHEFSEEIDFQADLDNLRKHGFNTLVLCVSEKTLENASSLQTVSAIVEQAHKEEVKVLADPWGLGKVFGGEGISYFHKTGELGCFCNPEFEKLLLRWLEAVWAAGVDGVMWDEPETRCTKHNEVDLIAHYALAAKERGLYNMVCFVANEKKVEMLDNLAALPAVDNIGCDPYWPNAFTRYSISERPHYIERWSKVIFSVAHRHGKDAHLWLQGFNIPADDLQMIAEIAAIMRKCGVPNLALWGFKGCASLFDTENNPSLARPEDIWREAGKVFGV